MTITSEFQVDGSAAPASGRRRRGLWIMLGVVLVLAVAGAITGTVWYRHYADPPPLRVDSTEIAWIGDVPSHTADAGPYSAAVTTAERGDQRTFVLYVHNPSDVTQTILGLTYSTKHTATPAHITISRREPVSESNGAPFARPPVAIPPHAYRALYYTVRIERCLYRSAQMYWTSLDLQVRSGAFIRHETLHFGTEDAAYSIEGTARRC